VWVYWLSASSDFSVFWLFPRFMGSSGVEDSWTKRINAWEERGSSMVSMAICLVG